MRILDAEAHQQVGGYIRNNPVARDLVAEVAEFPYSSAHAGFELDPAPQGLKPIAQNAAYGMAKAMP